MAQSGRVFLQDIRVAVLISDGFEEIELNEPLQDLQSAGAVVEILAQTQSQMQRGVQGMNGMRMTQLVSPRAMIQDVSPERYQGVLVPGGVMSVDHMRESRLHLGFLQNFFAAGKPIGLIGHAPWLLADSGVAQGRTLTSAPSIQKDLERAGAIWKDQEVIVDTNVITSRGLQDVPRFCQAFMDELGHLYRSGSRVA
ncbi:MAG: DJ-1/PfpI family protein [Bdellovibrionia bacterium]